MRELTFWMKSLYAISVVRAEVSWRWSGWSGFVCTLRACSRVTYSWILHDGHRSSSCRLRRRTVLFESSGHCVTMETAHRGEWWGAPEHVCGQSSISSLQEGSEQRFGFSALKDKRPIKIPQERPKSFDPQRLGFWAPCRWRRERWGNY